MINSLKTKSITTSFNKTAISNETATLFENIFNKYDHLVKLNYQQRLENLQVESILEELKHKLMNYNAVMNTNSSTTNNNNNVNNSLTNTKNNNNNSSLININYLYEEDTNNNNINNNSNYSLENEENILKLFKGNQKQKENFEEILKLRKRVKQLEEEINQVIQDEMKLFKNKYEKYKTTNKRNSFHYHILYSSLFGNSIII